MLVSYHDNSKTVLTNFDEFIWGEVCDWLQWRRSVVKYGDQGQSGQAIKLFQALSRKIAFTFRF